MHECVVYTGVHLNEEGEETPGSPGALNSPPPPPPQKKGH